MLIYNEKMTTEQFIETVKEIISLVANDARLNPQFQDLIRSLKPIYFDEWVSGTMYLAGQVFVHKGSKWQMIVDMPSDKASTDPSLALMREYCLAFDGMYPSIWKFKEPVRKDMQRYPYGEETKIYKATRDALSNENTMPPNEDTTGLWELPPSIEII